MPANIIRRLDSWGLLQPSLALLRRIGLLTFAYRWYERLAARAVAQAPRPQDDSGVPLPPSELVFQVAGSANIQWYLDCGRAMFETFVELIERQRRLAELRAVLDFGCGCGRVLRYWNGVRGPTVHGTDYNPAMIAWCRQNLPFAQTALNAARPPLAYADASFDCIYAVSVFTHLAEELQDPWLRELTRILAPGGCLLITTQGTSFRGDLSEVERAGFDRGELVVRYQEGSGTNLCGVYHPPAYAQHHLTQHLRIGEFVPAGTRAGVNQDIYLLLKPA